MGGRAGCSTLRSCLEWLGLHGPSHNRLLPSHASAAACTPSSRRWYNKATQQHIEAALRLYGSAPLVTVLHPPVEPFPAPADELEADKALLAAARQAGGNSLVGEVGSGLAQAHRSLQGSFSWKTDTDQQAGAGGTLGAAAGAAGAAGARGAADSAGATGAAGAAGSAGWEGAAADSAAGSVLHRRKDIMMLGRFFRGRQSKVGGWTEWRGGWQQRECSRAATWRLPSMHDARVGAQAEGWASMPLDHHLHIRK